MVNVNPLSVLRNLQIATKNEKQFLFGMNQATHWTNPFSKQSYGWVAYKAEKNHQCSSKDSFITQD